MLDWEESDEHHLGYTAFKAGGALRTIGAAALPVVSRMLLDDPASIAAVRALGWIGPSAVPRLREALGGPSAAVREAAAHAVARIGPEASAAVSDLAPLLREEDTRVACAAAVALARVGPAAAPALAAALDEDLAPKGLAWAVRLLSEMGRSEAALAAGAFARLAGHEDEDVRLAAGRALRRL